MTLYDEFALEKRSGIIFLQGGFFSTEKKPSEAFHLLQNGTYHILIKPGCSSQKAQLELGLKKSHSLHQELLVRLRVRPVGSPGQFDKVAVWEKLANSPHFSIVPPEGLLFA